jgi:hypothetical protein
LEWILELQELPEECKEIHRMIKEGKTEKAKEAIPTETAYPFPHSVARKIGAS